LLSYFEKIGGKGWTDEQTDGQADRRCATATRPLGTAA